MKNYRVYIPYAVYVCVEVKADNEEQAKEMAIDQSYIDSYCGNGGMDKLIGVRDSNMSIEINDDYLDGNCKFSIQVEEQED